MCKLLLEIKLYGGLICHNQNLESCGLIKFKLEMAQGATLDEVHKLLKLNPSDNLISIVNGHAQSPKHVLEEDCNISIFPPMSNRQ